MSPGLSSSRCLGELPRVDLATFEARFSKQDAPIVITGVADDWPARTAWTHDHLKRRLGLGDTGHAKALSAELSAEVTFPSVARIRTQENVWVMPDGYVSELHFDLPHNLNTVLGGEKEVHLFHPRETRNLYPCSPFGRDGAQNSRVALDRVDPKFRRVRGARYWKTTIRSGETLYIPPFFWHFVRSRGESVAVNVWFHVDEHRLRRIARWPRGVMIAIALSKLRGLVRLDR